MARPWETLDRQQTRDGLLELRRRGPRDFLITLDGRVLMTSVAHRSESALASLACAHLADVGAPRVLIGGLGMGFTLRAALDALPGDARVRVAELHPVVVDWCRGPLAALTDSAVEDPRVRVEVGDVSQRVASRRGAFDAVLLDLFEGPRSPAPDHPLYGARALRRFREALAPGGVFGVWSEHPDRVFERALQAAGFRVQRERPGRGGRRHAVYLAFRAGGTPAGPPRGRARRRRSSAP